jgi:hypothetical protein
MARMKQQGRGWEAKLSVRLVDPDGDVIWTSAQESNEREIQGGKYGRGRQVREEIALRRRETGGVERAATDFGTGSP